MTILFALHPNTCGDINYCIFLHTTTQSLPPSKFNRNPMFRKSTERVVGESYHKVPGVWGSPQPGSCGPGLIWPLTNPSYIWGTALLKGPEICKGGGGAQQRHETMLHFYDRVRSSSVSIVSMPNIRFIDLSPHFEKGHLSNNTLKENKPTGSWLTAERENKHLPS